MKKAVFFDFHNTLATCDGWLQLEISALPGLVLGRLAKRGFDVPGGEAAVARATAFFRELRQNVRETGVEMSGVEGCLRVLASMNVVVPTPEVEQAVAELEQECLPHVEMINGADEVLSCLRRRGFALGVVSSAGYPPFVEMALEKLGLRAFFSEVVTSAGEGIYKSDPEIFRRASARLGVAPGEAVHIGDHPLYDVRTAKSAGLSAIWFAGQAKCTAALHGVSWDEASMVGSEADAIVERLDEIPGAIVRL